MSEHRCILVVDVTVDPEVEAEWNRWYDEVHVPDILGCPGFIRASRYLSEVAGERHYLTVYDLASPEAMKSEEFAKRRGWYQFAGKVVATVRVYGEIFSTEAA